VVGAGAKNAAAGNSAPLINNEDSYLATYAAGNAYFGSFVARFPGSRGNSLKVSIADGASFTGWEFGSQFDGKPDTSPYAAGFSGSHDEVHIIVIDKDGLFSGTAGTVLERFPYASKASDGKRPDGTSMYYKDLVNQTSKYVYWASHPTGGTNWGTTAQGIAFANLTSNVTVSLGNGTVGTSVVDGNVQAGLALFANDEAVDVSLIPLGAVSAATISYAIGSIAEVRRDCVVFASPLLTTVYGAVGQEAANLVTFRDSLPSSSYAVLDSGWKYQYDRYNDVYRWVPLNGDVAGSAVRTDFVADPWFSPAGFNRGQIKNVVKLAYSPGKADRDIIYKKGINPVVTFPGNGTVLYGDKTLQSKPSAFDRINVRRLFIVLEKAIATAAKFQLFEFNDGFTRAQFRNLVEPFLRDVQGRRGITEYKVVCDESNNTGGVIDRNEFVADIFVKPARAINFIQLNFVATRSGISFEEVGA
jgi:hypothetical protein